MRSEQKFVHELRITKMMNAPMCLALSTIMVK